ncbi:hypothetical protein BU24DRAFT_420532 [Aaosphaeria arxii CBS 175.79]|uniref:ZZ-type domain-containing protein n=1 Tax=Aaosphaeria arxii CBS 175.79 TaxID=1450172 RepID=A0A6A5XXN8_9PLEO|nr:uncharacterized protein BU24DRAFT_420532 [Aaosphaeria arxii CBS 175.79]KAF2017491.1 hypothetical protein BU24DRAFT_420532 [Aaosphaeria arxii CBS 175.79]
MSLPNQDHWSSVKTSSHTSLGATSSEPGDHRTSTHSTDGFRQHRQNATISSVAYVQPYVASPPVIPELAAPAPPALPTSTSAKQLNEDELLARKLLQMEIEEAQGLSRVRSTSSTSQGASQIPMSATSTMLGETHLNSPISRQHTLHVSSKYGPDHYAQAAQLQQSPTANAAELAPEVVQTPRQPTSPCDVAPEVVTGPAHQHHVHTSTLRNPSNQPPPPSDHIATSQYLETHHQVPYPPQWILPPAVATFHSHSIYGPKADWLESPEAVIWGTARRSEKGRGKSLPTYYFTCKKKGGSLRAPRYQWSMTNPIAEKKADKTKELFKYELRLDPVTNKRKTETLVPIKGRDLLPTYVHAINYDSLNFIGPDGKRYKWVTHAPVNSFNLSRYDTLRHALFVSTITNGNQDPLFGQIVADHAYWDGYNNPDYVHSGIECGGCTMKPIIGTRWGCKVCESHDVCDDCRRANLSVLPACQFTRFSLPDETLHIRSSRVDVPMVVATLQILKDWEKHTLRTQKAQYPNDFAASVAEARKHDLGALSYWEAGDIQTRMKMPRDELSGPKAMLVEFLKGGAELSSAVVDASGTSLGGGDFGGGDSGGGGHGGGGGDG